MLNPLHTAPYYQPTAPVAGDEYFTPTNPPYPQGPGGVTFTTHQHGVHAAPHVSSHHSCVLVSMPLTM